MTESTPAKPEQLRPLTRLQKLSHDDLVKVVNRGTYVRQPANWTLMSEQTSPEKAYLIVSGEVSIRKDGAEVATLGPGDVIGEIAILEHKLRTATVVSTSPLELIHFTDDALRHLLDEVPAFAEAIRQTAAERLAD